MPRHWLGNATARYVYYFGETVRCGRHSHLGSTARCALRHSARDSTSASLRWRSDNADPGRFEYSDGRGSVLVKKVQAEPEPIAGSRSATALDRQRQDHPQQQGQAGQAIRALLQPHGTSLRRDGSARAKSASRRSCTTTRRGGSCAPKCPTARFSRVEFSPWHVAAFDANDTAFDTDPANRSDWYDRRTDPTHPRLAEFSDAESTRAAEQLPSSTRTRRRARTLDSLGRDVIAIAHNRTPGRQRASGKTSDYLTFTKLDAEGKPLWIRDARGNLVMQYISPSKRRA